jgi:hypothetical protein
MSGDDFVWHVRLEGDESLRRAGGGAREKAAEEAAKKGPWRTALDRFVDGRDDERAWRRGAEGEEEVARRLRSLEPYGWTILHDLTIGSKGANLDHLAIGPAGVFALNTKNHLGKKVWVGERAVLVNGHKTDYLRSIRRETAATEKALSKALGSPVVVRGVIVVLADELTVKQQPAIATVVGRRHIARWLQSQPSVLPGEVVTATARAARLPSTWGNGEPGGVLDRLRVRASSDRSIVVLNPSASRMVLYLPQTDSSGRAYLASRHEDGLRLRGASAFRAFVAECVRCGLAGEVLDSARPAGPLATFDGAESWVEHPYREGIALIGDAAGTSDPTWGQGLSLTLRDVRVLRDALLANEAWDTAGHEYAAAHERYFELVRTTNSWFTRIFLESGPDADALRARVFPRLEEDPSLLPDTQVAGPDHAPPTEEHRRRLFGEPVAPL